MRTPEQRAAVRKELEDGLEILDAEDQAWEALSRVQRLTELGHHAVCTKTHAGYSDSCKYHEGTWGVATQTMQKWQKKITDLIALLPEADDEKILAVLYASQ